MAFWRIGNSFANTSPIDKLLDRPDHTLIEVLEEGDLLQELLAPNTKLVEYLREPEIMQQLVRLVVDPNLASPPPEENAKTSESTDNVVHESDQENELKSEEAKPKSPENEMESNNEPKPSEDEKSNNDNNDHNDQDDDSGSDNEHDEEAENENNNSYFDDDESRQHFASVACEILASDVWSITEALMESPELIDEIWAILDYPTPLSMTHATYFTKLNEHLLDKKTDEILQYIKSQDTFVERFMRHIDNPPLMDFLLKVISSDKPDNSTGIIEFLQHQKLITSLIASLGPEVSSSVQSAAGDFLKAFVTISANSTSDNTTIGPNELSRELVSEPCIRELVRLMLYGGSGLATGVGVVIEIIRKNNSDYDFEPVMYITIESHPPTSRDPIYLGNLVKIFSENLPKFNAMLIKKHDEVLKTPFGQIEPLGFERFKICELIAELLHCSNMALLNDVGGEAIVRARDLERIRVRKQLYETNGGYPPLEYSDLYAETEKSENDENKIENKISSEDSENVDVQPDSKDDVVSEDLNKLSLEQTAHKEGEEEPSAPPSESSLRVNPVVGDKLKIALVDNQIITHILNMFFQFPWNNFLHNVVFDIVQQVLNGPMAEGYNRYLAIDLFQTGKLTYLICDGQKKCAEYQQSHKCRLGYMGHLTLISEEVVKFTAVYPPETISPVVAEVVQDPEWIAYISETLTRTREQYNSILGGQPPEDSQNELYNPNTIILRNDEEPIEIENDDNREPRDDDDLKDDEDVEEFKNDNEKESEQTSDKFSRYVSQQMTNGGQFGSSDEDEDDDELWDSEKVGFRNQAFDNAPASEKEEPGADSSGKVQLLGSDVDDVEDDEDNEEDDDDLGLVRSKSYNEMSWDAEEAQKIVDSIKHIRP